MNHWTLRALSIAAALSLPIGLAGGAAASTSDVNALDPRAQVVLALTQTASQPGMALTHTTRFEEEGREILQTKVGETGSDGWAMRSTSRVVEGVNVTLSQMHWGTDWSGYGDWVSFATLTRPASMRPGSLDRKAVARVARADYITDLPTEFPVDYDWYPFQVAEPLLILAQIVSVDAAGDVTVRVGDSQTTYTIPMRVAQETDRATVSIMVDNRTGLVTSSDYYANYGGTAEYSSRIVVLAAGAEVPLTTGIPKGARTIPFHRYARAAGTLLLDEAAKMTAQYLNREFPGEVTRQSLADRGTRIAGDYVQTAGNLLSRTTSVFCPELTGSEVDIAYRKGKLILDTSCGWSSTGRAKSVIVLVDGKAVVRR